MSTDDKILRVCGDDGVMHAKRGAPTKFKPEYCDLLLQVFEEGGTLACFCARVDISADTFYKWMKAQPTFSEAHGRAIARAENFMISKGLHMMNSPSGLYNSKIWELMMKNRFGWSDKKEVKTEADIKVTATPISAKEAAPRLQALAEKLARLPASEVLDADILEDDE